MLDRRQLLLSAAAGLTFVGTAKGADGDVEKPSRRVKVGQIGTQHGHAAGKMETLRRLKEEFEVMGFVGGKLTDSMRQEFDGVPVMTEGRMLERSEVEAVLVETGMLAAYGMAQAAVKAGKHVHLDKPGAMKDQHAEFAAMRREAEQKGLVFQMGYMLRYNPAFQLMQRAVQGGWLGRITEIDAMIGKKLNEPERLELKRVGVGGMFELGCHLVDAVCWLMGGKPDGVFPFSRPTQVDGVVRIPDNEVAVLTYPTAVAVLRCNMADPFGFPRRRFMITGTEGSIEVRPLESGKMMMRLTEGRGEFPKGDREMEVEVGGRYDAELKAFAEAVRGGKKLEWDAAHDIAVHETVLRAAGMK